MVYFYEQRKRTHVLFCCKTYLKKIYNFIEKY
nr:MAG TPA: hypothetical protein [Caudoviricetes sp.]